jgi:hypothetical protein
MKRWTIQSHVSVDWCVWSVQGEGGLHTCNHSSLLPVAQLLDLLSCHLFSVAFLYKHASVYCKITGLVAVPSTLEGDPVATCSDLLRTCQPPLMQQGTMEPPTLRHYVLVHDASAELAGGSEK